MAARAADFRERAVAYRAIGQFRFRTKKELLRRGLDDESPAVRGSALLSLERLSRDHPGDVNDLRPLLHELVTHDGNEAVRRLAVVALRNGSAAARHDPDPRVARRGRRAAARAPRRGREGRAGAPPQGHEVDDYTDPRWLARATRWIESHVEVTGPIEQPHIRSWATALRIPTGGRRRVVQGSAPGIRARGARAGDTRPGRAGAAARGDRVDRRRLAAARGRGRAGARAPDRLARDAPRVRRAATRSGGARRRAARSGRLRQPPRARRRASPCADALPARGSRGRARGAAAAGRRADRPARGITPAGDDRPRRPPRRERLLVRGTCADHRLGRLGGRASVLHAERRRPGGDPVDAGGLGGLRVGRRARRGSGHRRRASVPSACAQLGARRRARRLGAPGRTNPPVRRAVSCSCRAAAGRRTGRSRDAASARACSCQARPSSSATPHPKPGP